MSPDQITIAVTVYDRRTFVLEAIRSALDQTRPVRVIVVEDCGPDAGLRDFIEARVDRPVTYYRNPRRRGLFGNWNACLDYCETPWLSILHDDDLLAPGFVAAMQELADAFPGCTLYHGQNHSIQADGRPVITIPEPAGFSGEKMDLPTAARHCPIGFPGQLMQVSAVREAGGFRETSRYAGDWEMWFRLALTHGAAGTNRVTASLRAHDTVGRGTTTVDRNGRRFAYTNMQRKRNYRLLEQRGGDARFDRAAIQLESPLPARYLLRNAAGFSDWMLAYNQGLLQCSRPSNFSYRAFKSLAGWFGPQFIRLASRVARQTGWPD